jgi:dsRNA-specific ribonuclease
MAMESISKFLPNVLKNGRKASFILFDLDQEDLESYRKKIQGVFGKNTLLIEQKKPRKMKEDEFYVNRGVWSDNSQQYIEKTKGSFVIHDNVDLEESDFEDLMENYKKYYPVIFISPSEDQDYYTKPRTGWKEYTTKTGITIFVSRSRKNFETYIVDFETIFKKNDINPIMTTDVVVNDRGDKLVKEIFPVRQEKKSSKNISTVSVRKPGDQKEENWSIFEGLPVPSMRPDPGSKTWVKEFYLYLKDLVSRIVPPGKEKLTDFIVNKNTIKNVWLDVFTSMFSNPNPGENYETYESVGDAVVKYVFYIYLYERFPTISPSQLNQLKTDFLSTSWQGKLGGKMGLTDWLLIPEELSSNLRIKEDMQEAFIGGIEVILNKVAPSRGYSTTIVLYMYDQLFKDYDFPIRKKMAPLETKVEQWLSQIYRSKSEEKMVVKKPQSIDRKMWKDITKDFHKVLKDHGVIMDITENAGKVPKGVRYEEDINKDDKSAVYRVYLDDIGYKVLKEKGFPVEKIKDKFLSEVRAATLGQAKTNARVKAMEKLQSLGLTDEWLENLKVQKNNKDLSGVEEALMKAREEYGDIVKIYPSKGIEKMNNTIYQLIGVFRDDREIVLETLVTDSRDQNKPPNIFQKLFDDYLEEDEED